MLMRHPFRKFKDVRSSSDTALNMTFEDRVMNTSLGFHVLVFSAVGLGMHIS